MLSESFSSFLVTPFNFLLRSLLILTQVLTEMRSAPSQTKMLRQTEVGGVDPPEGQSHAHLAAERTSEVFLIQKCRIISYDIIFKSCELTFPNPVIPKISLNIEDS